MPSRVDPPSQPRDTAVASLLRRMAEGDTEAQNRLLPLVYHELHRVATLAMADAGKDHTLQPTALVHEAYLRMVRGAHVRFEHERHFFAFAARAMRSVLVDHARRRSADKRGGGVRPRQLDAQSASVPEQTDTVLAVHEAIERLAQVDAQLAELVELRCFAGLPLVEAAAALSISPTTAKRSWRLARAFLERELRTIARDAG
jgi:RNA polymerase sigma factor (TIGR02999 family)